MSLVWDNFNRGGSEKLAMLALADWCNDDGLSLHPSIRGVAEKINVSESQARRILHKFIKEGFLEVIANHGGGNPGQSRHYKLNVKMLATPGMDATPSASATPSMDARDPLHPCALPLAPMTPEPPLTIIKPPLKKNNKKKNHIRDLLPEISEQTFNDFVAHRKNKRALITETAVNGLKREAKKAKISLENALIETIERGWIGFKADWYLEKPGRGNGKEPINQNFTDKQYGEGGLL